MSQYSLVGIDGNAFAVMGYVRQCMKDEGKSNEDIEEYLIEAKSSDYSHLIAVSAEMVEKLNEVWIERHKNALGNPGDDKPFSWNDAADCLWCGERYELHLLNQAADTGKYYCEDCSGSLFKCDSCDDFTEEDFSEDDEQVLCESCERNRKLEEG